MSNTITPPKANIPVGRLKIGNQTYDVDQHPEFVRFFYDFFRRLGGTTSMSNGDLASAINDLSLAPPPEGFATLEARLSAISLQPGASEALPAEQRADARIESLEAEVHRLSVLVSGLTMGYQL